MSISTTRQAATNRGLIGARELVAMQTTDIARLTTHIAPIVPGSFIAVSGRGPKGDSNGSGKTSFQAAVTVLLADPQWRFDINGGSTAAGLLFQAESAGLDGAHFSADHGYIIGVFADPDFPMRETSVTVWVRLSTSSPHLVVRTAPGIVVVEADSDEDRYRQADELWVGLSRETQLSARKMAEHLYGDAPRCLAFLDTPLRKAAPSLLSQAMTEMSPTDIGQALIDLAGLRHQFEAEQEQRGKLSIQERELAESGRSHAEKARDEDVELAAIHDRNRARDLMKTGALMWRLHFAKRYLEVVPASAIATDELKVAEAAVSSAGARVSQARTDLREVENDTEAATREAAAEAHRKETAGRLTVIDQEVNRLTGELNAYVVRRPRLVEAAYGWDETTVEDAEAALTDALRREAEARATNDAATTDVSRCADALVEAREGRSPQTTAAINALALAGVSCAGLADALTLDAAARAYWEAVLWPWRDAIIVSPIDLDRAVIAVAALPGTILVASDQKDITLPRLAGVRSNQPIASFLSRLAARHNEGRDPQRVHDESAGIVTIGGFPDPITGRDARVATAQAALHEAERGAQEAAAALERAAARVSPAQTMLDLARAARDLAVLDEAIADVRGQIDAATVPRPAAAKAAEDAENTWKAAVAQRAGYDARLLTAQNAVQDCLRDQETAMKDKNNLLAKIDALNVPYWKNGWGGTENEARELLDAQDSGVAALKPNTLRRRASDALRDALVAYGADQSLSDDLAALTNDDQRQRILEPDNEGSPGTVTPPSFADFSMPLQARLDGMSSRDAVTGDSIQRDRAMRERNLAELNTEVVNLGSALTTLQDMIEQSVDARFNRMSAAFDRLSTGNNGFGADLLVKSERPVQSTDVWRWQVTPRWRRAQGGSLVGYKTVANGAQIKVAAFHLTLSALIAGDAEARAGQVLVIDELGNSLGDVNRKQVLQALQDVAESERVTILGVCQDSVLDDAVTASRQLLWFTHAAEHQALNQPVRSWGFDENQQRIELLGDQVRSGRPWL